MSKDPQQTNLQYGVLVGGELPLRNLSKPPLRNLLLSLSLPPSHPRSPSHSLAYITM